MGLSPVGQQAGGGATRRKSLSFGAVTAPHAGVSSALSLRHDFCQILLPRWGGTVCPAGGCRLTGTGTAPTAIHRRRISDGQPCSFAVIRPSRPPWERAPARSSSSGQREPSEFVTKVMP